MKKGFTLIELLAVILILGIIALIAVPQVTNVIENAHKGAAETSAEHYVGAVNTTIGLNKLDADSSNDIHDGVVDVSSISVDMTGETPTTGNLYVSGGTVVESELEVNGKMVYCDKKGKCTAFDKYVYYNKSSLENVDGNAIAWVIEIPDLNDCTMTKPTEKIYARYKFSREKIIPIPDICDVDSGICISTSSYEVSSLKILDLFGFDKSTWTYINTYRDSKNRIFKKWRNSAGSTCDFYDEGTDSESVICANASNSIVFESGKNRISIMNHKMNCIYDINIGITCASND